MSIFTSSDFFTSRDYRFLIHTASGQLELMTRKGQVEDAEQAQSLTDWLVVVCHPHPQHGGTMDNKVVTTVARAARESGLDSLRFNYRGVGKSTGDYGNFDGECEDFDSILKWVESETNKTKLILVGFSFGSAVVAVRANKVSQCEHAVLIAPPVERYAYPNSFTMAVSIIQGADDEVVEASAVTTWVKDIESEYDYYYSGQTSHFFHGKLVELRWKLSAIFSAVVH